jgi:hypothetical protein
MVRETLDRWAADAARRQLFEVVKAIELGLALARGEYRLKDQDER